ncbi:energy transducer TonB [candidate division KSB1 bacterium]|nr:energy transducer TonB [candidate division KSB1 bacterium]
MVTKGFKLLIGILAILILVAACSEKMEDPVQTEMTQKEVEKPADPPEGVEFVEYDVHPKPVGGFIAIQQNLEYPEIARKTGIEGRTVVYAKVNTDGDVVETKISESVSVECDAAAVKAIKATKWDPALKDENPVDVWIAIPIDFRLK